MSALADYLDRNRIKQKVFARRLKVTPERVSQICGGSQPSFDLALAIERETNGAVRPADLARREAEKPARRRA